MSISSIYFTNSTETFLALKTETSMLSLYKSKSLSDMNCFWTVLSSLLKQFYPCPSIHPSAHQPKPALWSTNNFRNLFIDTSLKPSLNIQWIYFLISFDFLSYFYKYLPISLIVSKMKPTCPVIETYLNQSCSFQNIHSNCLFLEFLFCKIH
jgi:hypothetical protein